MREYRETINSINCFASFVRIRRYKVIRWKIRAQCICLCGCGLFESLQREGWFTRGKSFWGKSYRANLILRKNFIWIWFFYKKKTNNFLPLSFICWCPTWFDGFARNVIWMKTNLDEKKSSLLCGNLIFKCEL